MNSEHDWLRRLGAAIGPLSPSIRVGIGDDAAVLSPPPGDLIATVDACVEGVHFTRAIASLEDVGFRSFTAAVSDLAAMAAHPLAALSALTLPPGFSEEELDQLVAGQRLAALAARTPLVGGNLSRGGCLSVTTTALGHAARPALRGGAAPGHRLWLAGPVGLAAAGLRALLRGVPAEDGALRRCVLAWRRPGARLDEGAAVASRVAAMIDISDGLAQDAEHLALAGGVHLVLRAEAVLAAAGPTLREAAAALGEDPCALAFSGGEDYALLAASDDDLGPHGFAEIGAVEPGSPGVTVLREGAPWRPPPGFDHGEKQETTPRP